MEISEKEVAPQKLGSRGTGDLTSDSEPQEDQRQTPVLEEQDNDTDPLTGSWKGKR